MHQFHPPTHVKMFPKHKESSILTCDNCKKFITSDYHNKNCSDVFMGGIIESLIFDAFKPMMTYGLGGCTALLMVFLTKDNVVHRVVLGHDASTEKIEEWFIDKYKRGQDYNIVTVIKTPGEYQKDGDSWKLIAKNQEYWDKLIKKNNCKLILEPYSTTRFIGSENSFESTLYFKMNPGPQYSNNYGKYIDIKF